MTTESGKSGDFLSFSQDSGTGVEGVKKDKIENQLMEIYQIFGCYNLNIINTG